MPSLFIFIPRLKAEHLVWGDVQQTADLAEGFDVHFVFAGFIHSVSGMRKPERMT